MITLYDKDGEIIAEVKKGSGYVDNCVADKSKVDMIHVEGEELALLASQVEGFPVMRRSLIVTYRGELARFIVDNVYL